jgi:hypothetical protein
LVPQKAEEIYYVQKAFSDAVISALSAIDHCEQILSNPVDSYFLIILVQPFS